MTLLQLKYVVSCAKYASINKAADSLFTSPSNVSKAIKSLEDELGFAIFIRNTNGLILTPLGEEVLQLARSVVEDCNKILSLDAKTDTDSLSICYNQIPYVKTAFNKFCGEALDGSDMQLQMYQGNYTYCIEQLLSGNCQLAIISFLQSGASAYKKDLEKNNLELSLLATANATLVIRKDHPIFDGCGVEDVDYNMLTKYPYANFTLAGYSDEIVSPHHVGGELWPINPKKIIDVNNTDQKIQLVRNTNSYTFTSSFLEKPLEYDGLLFIPNVEIKFHYYCINRSKNVLSNHSLHFISVLNEVFRTSVNPLGE